MTQQPASAQNQYPPKGTQTHRIASIEELRSLFEENAFENISFCLWLTADNGEHHVFEFESRKLGNASCDKFPWLRFAHTWHSSAQGEVVVAPRRVGIGGDGTKKLVALPVGPNQSNLELHFTQNGPSPIALLTIDWNTVSM